jgi:transposase
VSKRNSASPNTTWVGLDVHRDSITSAVLAPGVATPALDRLLHDEPCVRRFVKSLGNPKTVRLCYEAGPTGS